MYKLGLCSNTGHKLSRKITIAMLTCTILMVQMEGSTTLYANPADFLSTEDIPQIKEEINSLMDKFEDQTYQQNEELKIPFSGFIENQRQISDPEIMYYYSSESSFIGFGLSEILLSSRVPRSDDSITFSLSFFNSNNVKPTSMSKLPHSTNYFIADLELTNVASWGDIWYLNLYEKIDLHYFMVEEGLKYEFIVHPGGNPNDIIIQANDPIQISVTPASISFLSRTTQNEIYQDTDLKVFQEDFTPVASNFNINQEFPNSYGFDVDNYDATQNLIIDPFLAHFSTYFGGSGDERGYKIAVDSSGNSYIGGCTDSFGSFPVKNANSSFFGSGINDAFVFKLDPQGALVFSTYIGSSSNDDAQDIAVDVFGNVIIAGTTFASDFPVYNAIKPIFGGGAHDGYITKFNSTGNGLIFSTFIGGSGKDTITAMDIDQSGNISFVGDTWSCDLPVTTGAYQSTTSECASSPYEPFVGKLNNTYNGYVFFTYLGGPGSDRIHEIEVDASGNVYVSGETESTSFPTLNPYQTNLDTDGNSLRDVFLSKFNSTGGLLFSTYLGGGGVDWGDGLDVDDFGYCYLSGSTTSSDFPMMNSYQSTLQGTQDMFVTKLDTNLKTLVFSTYIGGAGVESAGVIRIDSSGNSYIAGLTASTDFPLKRPIQETYGGSTDIAVIRLNSTGNGVDFGTYFGGSNYDRAYDIEITDSNELYITGFTDSNDFPVLNPAQGSFGGDRDIFVTKFNFTLDTTLPDLSCPTDVYYVEGTTGNSFQCVIGDKYPDKYNVTLDGTPHVANTAWINGTIDIPIDELLEGNHTAIITVYDWDGNSRSSTIIIVIIESIYLGVDSPFDLTYIVGTTGHVITWTPVISYFLGDVLNVTLDGVVIISWVGFTDDPININVDGLEVGSHELTITMTLGSEFVIDTVIVTVIEIITPNLNSPDDTSYLEGSTGNVIIWTVGDKYPDMYNVTLNGELYVIDNWVNGSIVVVIDGLVEGSYTFIIAIYDESGNVAVDEVNVNVIGIGQVIDVITPELNSPEDISYREGSTGNVIIWTAGDNNPGIYSVTLSGEVYVTDTNWVNGSISVVVDGLDEGSHTFIIAVYDISGNVAIDEVKVNVNVKSDDPDLLGSDWNFMLLIGIIIIPILRKGKRKKF
jgi:hypothetical protein